MNISYGTTVYAVHSESELRTLKVPVTCHCGWHGRRTLAHADDRCPHCGRTPERGTWREIAEREGGAA